MDHLVLRAKMLEMGEPKAILGLALSPPYLDDIERTILQLKEVICISVLNSKSNFFTRTVFDLKCQKGVSLWKYIYTYTLSALKQRFTFL